MDRPEWMDEFADLVERMERLTSSSLPDIAYNLQSYAEKADNAATRMRSAAEQAANAAWTMRA